MFLINNKFENNKNITQNILNLIWLIFNNFLISIKSQLRNLKLILEEMKKIGYHYNNNNKIVFFIKMIVRSLFNQINETLFKGYVVLIFGTRRAGKTTLLEELIRYHESMGRKIRYLNCDLISARQMIDTTNDQELKSLVEGVDILAIDEAQNIETIGKTLKIIHDVFPKVQVIATGSSSFDLANKTGEPLVGRMRQFLLYPFSVKEIWKEIGPVEARGGLDNFLKYGLYPKIYG
ncbi:MAG: AAA family ATPase, partial [Methanobacterium sp.]|nr:AAA family ATPase [Methanobacterium sp.]